ncbi:MAG: hypothetical protein KDD48_05035 [Bdellovibrionales bacterium]|nr:hypothetical protein [Bdellovibrionales bacterium]
MNTCSRWPQLDFLIIFLLTACAQEIGSPSMTPNLGQEQNIPTPTTPAPMPPTGSAPFFANVANETTSLDLHDSSNFYITITAANSLAGELSVDLTFDDSNLVSNFQYQGSINLNISPSRVVINAGESKTVLATVTTGFDAPSFESTLIGGLGKIQMIALDPQSGFSQTVTKPLEVMANLNATLLTINPHTWDIPQTINVRKHLNGTQLILKNQADQSLVFHVTSPFHGNVNDPIMPGGVYSFVVPQSMNQIIFYDHGRQSSSMANRINFL